MRSLVVALAIAGLLPATFGPDRLGAQTAPDRVSAAVPPPTGPNPVGTVTWHWADPDTPDLLTPDPDDVRELMVQAWYPAASERAPTYAAYAPLYPALSQLRSWSLPSAAVARAPTPWPVIVIAPGRGVGRHYYTSVAEDLSSHGYFVVAVDSPHSGRVAYPDGRAIPPHPKYAIPFAVLTGPYERVDEFFSEAAELGARDLAFVLRQLADLNRADPVQRLTGRLDLTRLGALGHSLGGRIAGAAVAADERFLAYASMEGVPPRDVRRGGMDAAVMMMVSSGLPDMAQPNIREIIPNRRADVFVATLKGFGHNSVTDLPLLHPGEYGYEIAPAVGIETVRVLLKSFFDRYVRGTEGTFHLPTMADLVGLERFEYR